VPDAILGQEFMEFIDSGNRPAIKANDNIALERTAFFAGLSLSLALMAGRLPESMNSINS